MTLSGKVALVTGAGRGLGRGHAMTLAAAGAKVVVNDVGGSGAGEGSDAGPAHAVVEEIRQAGGDAVADTRSVSDWDTAHQIVDDAVARFGKLDILVNNAGINRVGLFGDLTERDWDLQYGVNLKGPVALMDAAVKHWRAAGPMAGRAIVNTASPAAPHPLTPIALYSGSKAAVLAVTQAAAQELAPLGVRVNALAPMARTRLVEESKELLAMMPSDPVFDRFLPENVSRVVLYLSSELCRFTGRLFGSEGDDVFLFKEWSAEHHANNGRAPWTPEALERALADTPAQDTRWTLFPGRRVQLPSPGDEVLEALRKASAPG